MSAEDAQLLRYAADLARLYRSSRDDRRRFRAVEESCLDLVRALSVEEVAQRTARAAMDLLELPAAAVYLLREGRVHLAARLPADAPFPPIATVRREELDRLGARSPAGPATETGAPWSELVRGTDDDGPAIVLPLLGRRRAVGFLVAPGALEEAGAGPRDGPVALLREPCALLGGHAGVVLENFLLEERRAAAPGEGRTGGRSEGKGAGARPSAGALPPSAAGGGARGLAGRDGEGGAGAQGMLGSSPAMARILGLIRRIADVTSPVLILGETGTGKSMAAKVLHEAGPRRAGPFVTVNCGAIPDALLESELFGHEAGAFTGALRRHRGKVEQAHGGTLFLDEVGELPPAAQVKLLSFLERACFTRVGGEEELSCDVRVVSATNRDLEEAVASAAFRRDLLFRLNVFAFTLPPLRERGADVVALARALAREVASRYGLPEPDLHEGVRARLLAYPWPGNVRELRNVLEKTVILAGEGPLDEEDLPGPADTPFGSRAASLDLAAAPRAGDPAPGAAPSAAAAAAEPPAELPPGPMTEPAGGVTFDAKLGFSGNKQRVIERWEVAAICELLERTGGNIAAAARLAQLDKKNLHRKLKRYGIDAREHKDSA